jgi:hypothetical protein
MHPFVTQRHIVIFKTRPRGLENLEMGCAVNAADVPVFSGDRHHVLARGRSVQRRGAREIPVMFVARNSLVMPVQPAGRRVDGNEGVGVDGVAWIVRGDVAVEVGVGIGDAGEHLAGRGIERIAAPEAAAGAVSERGVEAPQLLPGIGVEGHQAALEPGVAVRQTDEHLSPPRDGRRGKHFLLFGIRRLHVP